MTCSRSTACGATTVSALRSDIFALMGAVGGLMHDIVCYNVSSEYIIEHLEQIGFRLALISESVNGS